VKARLVKCPTCGRDQEWSPDNRWRPFCSERCRLIDLGAWLDERHTIPGEPSAPPDGETDPEASDGRHH
jgi:uncharacterized protein